MKIKFFHARWCGNCKMLEEFLKEVKGLEIEHIDVENNPDIAEEYGVMTLPTIITENGENIIGLVGLDILREKLEE